MNDQERPLLEGIAREYTDPDPGRVIDQKLLALIIHRIRCWIQGPEVLELGFGDDQWTSRVVEAFGHSSVVEASEALAARARSRYGDRLTVYQSLFEEFEPPVRFNTVIASFVLEHVEDPVTVLRRAGTWLAPGGRVLVVVPHADSLHRRLAVCMGLMTTTSELGPTDRQMGHRRVYTVERMGEDISRAGLAVVRQKGLLAKLIPQGLMTGFPDAMLSGMVELGESLPMAYCATIAFDCILANCGDPPDRGSDR